MHLGAMGQSNMLTQLKPFHIFWIQHLLRDLHISFLANH